MQKTQFTLTTLHLTLFWFAVFFASVTSIGRLHATCTTRPWYLDSFTLWSQIALNLCIGTALGGLVGVLRGSRVTGPMIGLAIFLFFDVLWLISHGFHQWLTSF